MTDERLVRRKRAAARARAREGRARGELRRNMAKSCCGIEAWLNERDTCERCGKPLEPKYPPPGDAA